jgi:hypothetical protein
MLEEQVTRADENMGVQGEILAGFEQRVDQFTERTKGWMILSEKRMKQAEDRMALAEDRMAQLESISMAVLERMD